MAEASSSNRPSGTNPKWQFKAITFGVDSKSVQPSRRQSRVSSQAELPFIVTSASARSVNNETRSFIRRHVMNEFVLKGNKKPLPPESNEKVHTSLDIRPKEIWHGNFRHWDIAENESEKETNGLGTMEPNTTFDGAYFNSKLSESGYVGSLAQTEDLENDIEGLEVMRSPNPKSCLGQGRVDPFSTYPVKPTWSTHSLLDHCE